MKTKIDVVLVNPNPGGAGLNEATVLIPLGLGYLAAALEQEGFSCSIIDANCLNLSPEEILKRIPRKRLWSGSLLIPLPIMHRAELPSW